MKERVKQLCGKKGVSMNTAESEIGLAKGYISKLGTSNPNAKTLQKIADYFGVTVDYLMAGIEPKNEERPELGKGEQLDVARDADEIILRLENGDSALMRFEPDSLNESDREYLRQSLISMFTLVRLRNKEKGNGDQKDRK